MCKICGKYTYLYMYMYIHLSHRGKSVRVFLFGDYEFQCRMYGISGAQGKKTTTCTCTCTCTMHLSLKIHAGRHPCLWCTILADQLKQPQHERGKLPLRTLDSLKADYLRFETIGKGDIRQAKNFNNVIGPVFFNVPLSQVLLHINTDCPFATYMPIMYKNAGESPRPPYNTWCVLSTVVPARKSLPST